MIARRSSLNNEEKYSENVKMMNFALADILDSTTSEVISQNGISQERFDYLLGKFAKDEEVQSLLNALCQEEL